MTSSLERIQGYEKNSKFKIFKVMKFTFKKLFSQLLLCITFDDRF
jgi:hypothetical protein